MLDFESITSGKPVPAVDTSDLKRVWQFISEAPRPEGAATGTVSWDISLVAGQCSQGADALAIFVRLALLGSLLDGGLLDEWREGDRPYDVVFRALATFPLPEGMQNFRADEFENALREAL